MTGVTNPFPFQTVACTIELDPFIIFQIFTFKFKLIGFEKSKFKFIDFKKVTVKFKFIDFEKTKFKFKFIDFEKMKF